MTFHPETLSTATPVDQVDPTLAALAALQSASDLRVLATGSNLDAGAREIDERVQAWVADAPDTRFFVTSLGRRRYYSAVATAAVVIGNSSSGIIEAPSFHTPTVNVGDRQAGRPRAASVIDTANEVDAIVAALELAVSPSFGDVCDTAVNPYRAGQAGPLIASTLVDTDPAEVATKRFVDRPLGG